MIESTDQVSDTAPPVNITEKDKARFWAKVNKDGPEHPYDPKKGKCWDWAGTKKSKSEYGHFGYGGRVGRVQLGAHRFSLIIHKGNIAKGLDVCHSCNRPSCVNPGHLSAGTRLDNMRYMVETGRSPVGERHGSRTKPERVARGESHPSARLSGEQICEIRSIYGRGGHTLLELGIQYRVSKQQVSRIVRRERWGNIT